MQKVPRESRGSFPPRSLRGHYALPHGRTEIIGALLIVGVTAVWLIAGIAATRRMPINDSLFRCHPSDTRTTNQTSICGGRQ